MSLGAIAAEQGAGFGTSGVRGLVTSLTPGLCMAYAEAFIAILDAKPRALGAETFGLARSDSFVAIDTEAVRPEDRALALQWAAEQALDAIVTTDGDADRPLIADETGHWLRGDLLGLLCARELAAGAVVTPVNSTTALEASGLFAEVRRTRIGSPHVIAGMAQPKHLPVVGFEANGGFLLGSAASICGAQIEALATRDALLPMLLVLAAARRRQCPVSALMADLPERHSFSGRLQDVDLAACAALLAAADASDEGMERLFGERPVAVNRIDGLRATLTSGDILHVRPSGNAPELRCYAEARDAATAERLCGTCLSRLAGLLTCKSP